MDEENSLILDSSAFCLKDTTVCFPEYSVDISDYLKFTKIVSCSNGQRSKFMFCVWSLYSFLQDLQLSNMVHFRLLLIALYNSGNGPVLLWDLFCLNLPIFLT